MSENAREGERENQKEGKREREIKMSCKSPAAAAAGTAH